MTSMFDTFCRNCGGLVADPGKALGYAGKFCHCGQARAPVLHDVPRPVQTRFKFAAAGMKHYYLRDRDSLSRLLDFMEIHMEKSIVLSIARVAHEVNRAYCQSLGDYTQPTWEDAPNWQRDSACKGVQLHLANPDMTPAQSHEGWMEEKLRTGWRFGEVKDPNAKTHPCMVPYEQLPQEQRCKDFLFRGVVHAIAREMARPA